MKHGDALEIAAVEGFTWKYEDADEDDLYEAIEALGYVWDQRAGYWIGPESERNPNHPANRKREAQRAKELQALEDWNAGRPIKGRK